MSDYLINPKFNFRWMIFHLSLGFLCTFSKWFLIIWFYLFIILILNEILSELMYSEEIKKLIPALIYLSSFEIMGRMLKAYPYLPWELSKYLIFFTMVFLILSGKVKQVNQIGLIILLLLIPGALIDKSGLVTYSEIINNLLGPVGLALFIMVIGHYRLTTIELEVVMRLLWNASIPVLVYVFLETPVFSELSYSLNAGTETTGGFGSNQISTILGVGMFLSFYAWMNKLLFTGYHSLDGFFIGFFAFQGFLSFSRGGMIVGIIAILLYYFLFRTSRAFTSITKIRSLRPLLFFGLAVTFVLSSYIIIQNLSSGNLGLRYAGETMGTLIGGKTKTLNTVTTGRYVLLKSDMDIWNDHFIFGSGAGASKFLRDSDLYGKAPHTEFSRLLAEHGLFGFVILIITFFLLIKIYRSNKNNINIAILIVFYFIAVGTSMHSAMRTFVTPIFLALSAVNIISDN